jgi:transcriptional regulator with XRE-family HTH domain
MKAYEQIGRKLQKAREGAGMSQEELAGRLGYTQASLSNYELGKRRLYLSDLQRISQILSKPITYFLEDAEKKQADQDDMGTILNEQYLKEILYEARALKPAQRKSVLDYIQWQKSKATGDRK